MHEKITVRNLIKMLLDYNLDAYVSVIAHCRKFEFSLTNSNGEGCTKENCKEVSFYVDELCNNEKTEPDKHPY